MEYKMMYQRFSESQKNQLLSLIRRSDIINRYYREIVNESRRSSKEVEYCLEKLYEIFKDNKIKFI